MAKKISWLKQGLLETNSAVNGVIFPTTITLFNQVIHHYDRVKTKTLSSFTLKAQLSPQCIFKNVDKLQDP